MNTKDIKINWLSTTKLGIFFLLASLFFACNDPKPSTGEFQEITDLNAEITDIDKLLGVTDQITAEAAIENLFTEASTLGLEKENCPSNAKEAKDLISIRVMAKNAIAAAEKNSAELEKAKKAVGIYGKAATDLKKAIEKVKEKAGVDPKAVDATVEGDKAIKGNS